MRILVFSDIHGNLPALEAMLQAEGPADQYICLGDVVNYGPWGEECLSRVLSLPNGICLEGNHETYFLKNEYEGSHPLPGIFLAHSIRRFRSFGTIARLPKEHRRHGCTFVHTLEDRYIYADTAVDLKEDTFIGHSHHAFIREIQGHTLVNTGSVGQNRKYINLASYAVFTPETGEVEVRNTIYGAEEILEEMNRLGYPSDCIAYYERKERWPEGTPPPTLRGRMGGTAVSVDGEQI
ncbi:MAG: hypothetical protein RLY31_918 [Bacteroidota bacterium]|jgi:predicted phosphodiesterase